jgi:hypothetical protein
MQRMLSDWRGLYIIAQRHTSYSSCRSWLSASGQPVALLTAARRAVLRTGAATS